MNAQLRVSHRVSHVYRSGYARTPAFDTVIKTTFNFAVSIIRYVVFVHVRRTEHISFYISLCTCETQFKFVSKSRD